MHRTIGSTPFGAGDVARVAVVGVMSALVAACAGDGHAIPGPNTTTPIAALGQAAFTAEPPASYRVGPNDVLQIKVYGEPDLSFDRISVSQSGTIGIPFAGEVKAAGLTTGEVAQRLRAALGRQLIEPQIAVNLVEYGSQRITVEGSVNHAGVFPLPAGTTLLDALATAGGPDRFAKVRQIAIFRQDPDGRKVAIFDLHEVRAGTQMDPVLQANDRIVVGVSGGSRFYQDLLSLVPAAAIFSRF